MRLLLSLLKLISYVSVTFIYFQGLTFRLPMLPADVKHMSKQLLKEYVEWLKLRKNKGERLGYAWKDFPQDRAKYCLSKMSTPGHPTEAAVILEEIKTKMGLKRVIETIFYEANSGKGQKLEYLNQKGLESLAEFVSGDSKNAEASDTSEDEDL